MAKSRRYFYVNIGELIKSLDKSDVRGVYNCNVY